MNALSNLAANIKNLLFIWGSISAGAAGFIYYIEKYSHFLTMQSVVVSLVAIIIVTNVTIWLAVQIKTEKNSKKMDVLEDKFTAILYDMQVEAIKDSVGNFYRDNKDCEFLTENDYKQLLGLEDKMLSLGVNSYTQFQVNELKKKSVK